MCFELQVVLVVVHSTADVVCSVWQAGLANLLIADESSPVFDPMRSYDLFMEASEEAMDAGRMKLWERYSCDAEEKASPLCPE